LNNIKHDNTDIEKRLGARYQQLVEELKQELPKAYATKTVDKLLDEMSTKYGVGKTTLSMKVVKKLNEQFNLRPPAKVKTVKKQRYSEEEYQVIITAYEKLNMGVAEILAANLLGDRTPPRATIIDILRRKSTLYQEKNASKTKITEEQKKIVLNKYSEGIPILDIANDENLSRKTVEVIISQSGVDISQGKTEQEKLAIYHHYYNFEGKDATGATCKAFNISATRVRDIVREVVSNYSVPERDNSDSYRKYTLDQTFFDVIDTEEKAYILGLIATDGNVSNNVVSIELQRSDKEILEKISIIVKSNKPIMDTIHFDKRNNKFHLGAKLSLVSTKMVSALAILGVVPNKSLTLSVNLSLLPSQLHRHFWRGAIDGDGAIFVHENNFIVELYGSLATCESYQDYLSSHAINVNVNPHHSIWVIRTNSSNSLKISRHLYDSCNIFLERKFKEVNKNSQH